MSMATPTLNRWRNKITRALPWLRWATVAASSAAILIAAPPLPGVRLATTPSLAIAVIQLVRLTRAALRQPQLDREADDRLQVLIHRTCLPDVHLVEVVATEQLSAAGQRAHTIDLAHGHATSVWFPQANFPTGSLVLIELQDTLRVLDWMLPAEVEAAYGHRRRAARRRAKAETAWQHELTRDLAATTRRTRGNGRYEAVDRSRAA